MGRVDYSNGTDHPLLIRFCQECTAAKCDGICNAWKDRYREVYGYPPVNRHRPPVHNARVCGKKYVAFGEEHTIQEWAIQMGLSYRTLYERLHSGTWTLEDALLTPADPRNGKSIYITIDGIGMSISAWLREKGLPRVTYYKRIREGWSVEQAIMTPPPGRGGARRRA